MTPAPTRKPPGFYRFRSVWVVDATPHEAFMALRELRDYPAWWPEVRTATEVGHETYRLRCRSVLPYDLEFTTRRTREEPGALLEADLVGDLTGFSRWTLLGVGSSTHGTRTQCVFDEEVLAEKELLRKFEPWARPAFRANHALMMRHGHRGLQAYLAGLKLGRRTPD